MLRFLKLHLFLGQPALKGLKSLNPEMHFSRNGFRRRSFNQKFRSLIFQEKSGRGGGGGGEEGGEKVFETFKIRLISTSSTQPFHVLIFKTFPTTLLNYSKVPKDANHIL